MCNCSKTIPIPSNAVTITIGKYNPGPNIDTIVKFVTATGRIDTVKVTSGDDSMITIDAPGLRLNTPYTLTVFQADDPTESEQGFTIDNTTYTCLEVEFVAVHKRDDTNFAPGNFQLSIQ